MLLLFFYKFFYILLTSIYLYVIIQSLLGGFMKKQMKRLIASMIMAVAISTVITSGVLFYKYSNNYNSLNKDLEVKQNQLYNLLKNDPSYINALQIHITQLQDDFLSGRITAQQYDAELNELNTNNTFALTYCQKPEIQEKYGNEVSQIKEIEERIITDSQELQIPCFATGLIGIVGFSSGATLMMSTVEGEIEDYFNL